MTKAFLVAFLFLGHQVTATKPGQEHSPPKKLKVLSWNIYMLPHFVKPQSSKAARASAIGDVLLDSDYDVIFFQEAFQSTARNKILAKLRSKYPYQAGPANQRFLSLRVNSGLWMLSKYPIIRVQSITYKNKFGVDALSRKGALMVELDVEGQRIQVSGTHLQNCGPAWRRQVQCIEFYERLLKPNERDGIPQIICGDFNIDRHSAQQGYNFMLQALNAQDGNDQTNQFSYDHVDNDLQVERGTARDLIDYILFRNNGTETSCWNTVVLMKKKWSAHHHDLSDHYAVQAEIVFSNIGNSNSVALAK